MEGKEKYYYTETGWDRFRQGLKNLFDKLPLSGLFIMNGAFLAYWMIDLIPFWNIPGGDPIPVFDEILKTALLYYYNVYLLKRTYGIINPLRILRGQTPQAKKKLGILPYEQSMDYIRRRIKAMRKMVRAAQVPGLTPEKIERLAREVKAIEKRLHLLDKLLSGRAFQEKPVRAEMARIESLLQADIDDEMKADLEKSLQHASNHLANIERLREERNKLVAKLDRLRLQIDETYSRMLAMAGAETKPGEAERLMDELFVSVKSFDSTLQELEDKPSSGLYEKALLEIEEAEAAAQGRIAPRQPTKTS